MGMNDRQSLGKLGMHRRRMAVDLKGRTGFDYRLSINQAEPSRSLQERSYSYLSWSAPGCRDIPASSTPATASCPFSQSSVSKRSILRSRCPSDPLSKPLPDRSEDSARSRAGVSAQDFFKPRLKWGALDDVALA